MQNTDCSNVIPEIKNLIEQLHKDISHRFSHIESNLLNAESTERLKT